MLRHYLDKLQDKITPEQLDLVKEVMLQYGMDSMHDSNLRIECWNLVMNKENEDEKQPQGVALAQN